jgi:putative spermidine/putrescine transport system substrate-binding protein
MSPLQGFRAFLHAPTGDHAHGTEGGVAMNELIRALDSDVSADRSLTRRRLLGGGLGLGAALALGVPGRAAAQGGRIVYATWGGSWEKAIRQAWFEPFTKRTGIQVVSVTGPDYGKVRAMVQAKRTEWDVVEVNPDFQWIGQRDGLLEPLDFRVIDRSAIMSGPDLVTDHSVPQVVWSRVMFYNTKRFSKEQRPRTWAEVWDLKRYPGKRTFASKTNGGSLEVALLADGVAPDRLYPLDVERALRSLERLREHIIWFETNAQAEQFMTDEQAVLGLVPDGRALSAKQRGANVEIEYNQSLLTWSTMIVPTGAPNKEGAMRFLAYALSVEGQTAIANAYTYGPVVPKAFEALPRERALTLSGGPQQVGKYVLANERWWGENLEKVTERFNAWRLG